MDNATRAKRLAEIGILLEPDQREFGPRSSAICHDPASCYMTDGDVLLWLLRELPRRGYSPNMEHQWREGGWVYIWSIFQKGVGRKADVCDEDCLLALVDATIAAFERQAT